MLKTTGYTAHQLQKLGVWPFLRLGRSSSSVEFFLKLLTLRLALPQLGLGAARLSHELFPLLRRQRAAACAAGPACWSRCIRVVQA